jgi:hypothetical protein
LSAKAGAAAKIIAAASSLEITLVFLPTPVCPGLCGAVHSRSRRIRQVNFGLILPKQASFGNLPRESGYTRMIAALELP